MKAVWISIIVLLIFIILISLIIWFVRWQNKIRTNNHIEDEKIIKIILAKNNISTKYLNDIKEHIDIIHILDNLNYYDNNFYINKFKSIKNSEKTIDGLHEKLQNYKYSAKNKIRTTKNSISKENSMIEHRYIKIVKQIFNDENELTINLLTEIKMRIEKTKYEIQKAIANEKKDEVEVWKSEIDRLDKYIYIDKCFKKAINEIINNKIKETKKIS